MPNVKERLKEFIKFQGLTNKAFEESIGAGNGYVNSIVNSIGNKYLPIIIEKYPSLNRDWLLYGEGQMLNNTEPEGNAVLIGAASSSPLVEVRYFEVSPSATFQEFVSDVSEAASTITVHAIPGLNIDDTFCVFQAYGDSMAPQIRNHARVLCREITSSRWHTLHNCVIVIAYADKFVIKRIVRNELDTLNRLTLASDNPDYPEQHTVALSDIRCIFQAVRIIDSPIS